jgi:hypothetical protein
MSLLLLCVPFFVLQCTCTLYCMFFDAACLIIVMHGHDIAEKLLSWC